MTLILSYTTLIVDLQTVNIIWQKQKLNLVIIQNYII